MGRSIGKEARYRCVSVMIIRVGNLGAGIGYMGCRSFSERDVCVLCWSRLG